MEQELNSFEEKLAQFVAQFKRVRDENAELRQSVVSQSDEIKRIEEKLDMAKTRIEALIEQLPENQGAT